MTLKVINERYLGDESARLRFVREARAAASVRHPNVASVFHLGRSRGLLLRVGVCTGRTTISASGAFAGTPGFASPEQVIGGEVDIPSDLYSFGVSLWQMLTGQVPFRGSAAGVMSQRQHAPLPVEELESVPQPVVSLIEVLLDKDPKRRSQTPAELLKALPTTRRANCALDGDCGRCYREQRSDGLSAFVEGA